jgi:hypothetical protein
MLFPLPFEAFSSFPLQPVRQAAGLFTRASSAVPFLNAGFPDHQLSIPNRVHDFV